MHPGLLCGIGLSWYLPCPLHLGQVFALPAMTPVPEQPAHFTQKMHPALCGIVLRWTFPVPLHWKQAFFATGEVDGAPAGVPHFEQK
jgi:hypothetical protein